jgi:hypothetical protein
VQDAGGDIVALVDRNGGNPVVIAQWRYDAYGAVLSAEEFSPAPRLHLGHKGLFLDRLDVGVGSSSGEPPRLAPYAHGVYQIRNRAYSPELGRFYQRDPNASAMVLLENSSYHGRGIAAVAAAFDLDNLYGDGANLYEYLGSSPWQRQDPLGLSWDPFDAVDEYLAEAAGSTAAFLSSIGQDSRAVAVVAATIASYLPFPFVGNLGELALVGLGETSLVGAGADLALGMIPGGKLLAKHGKFFLRIGQSAWSAAKHYASKFASRVVRAGRGALNLLGKAKDFLLKRKPKAVCGCFAAGTPVWTADGLVPIEQVQVDDLVLTMNELTGEFEYRPVTTEIVTQQTALVEISLVHESGEAEILRTTDEHPFWAEGAGWIRADMLTPGTVLRTRTGTAFISSVSMPSGRTTVYNFSVKESPNYFAGAVGTWVHNCGPFWDQLNDLAENVLTGATPEELGWLFDELEKEGFTKDSGGSQSQTDGRIRLIHPSGRTLRYHPGGSRDDHFDGRPYWTISDGKRGKRQFPGRRR